MNRWTQLTLTRRAWGLIHADAVYTEVRTSPWTFDAPAADLEKAFADLEAGAQRWFDQEDVPTERRTLVREADMKFAGQIFEVTTRLPDKAITEQTKERIRAEFIKDYEAEFGAGTAWTESEVLLINTRIRASVESSTIGDDARAAVSATEQVETYERVIIDPETGNKVVVPVCRGFAGLGKAQGPCLIEEVDTTVYVPGDASASSTAEGHVVIEFDLANE